MARILNRDNCEEGKRPHWEDLLLVSAVAIAIESISRSYFLEFDTNMAIYAARSWGENQGPWTAVMMGWDLAIGNLTNWLGEPELAIWAMGSLLNMLAAIAVYLCGCENNINRQVCLISGLITAFWFLPPVGGWAGDNFSFLIGIGPALLFVVAGYKWHHWLSCAVGISFAYGLTLKLNSFLPAAGTSTGMIATYLILTNWQRFNWNRLSKSLMIVIGSTALSFLALDLLIPTGEGLYPTIYNFYSTFNSSSISEDRLSITRLLLIPLNQDFLQALLLGQKGVIAFSPIAIGFWASITICGAKLIKTATHKLTIESNTKVFKITGLILLLLIGSSLSCLTLGRGLSHRLFLMPGGIIYAIWLVSDNRKIMPYVYALIASYSATIWFGLAWEQGRIGRQYLQSDATYDVGQLQRQKKSPKLCIDPKRPEKKSIDIEDSVLYATPTSNYVEKYGEFSTCWTSSEYRQNFAGLGLVYDLSNFMNASYKNHLPSKGGDAYLVEGWDKSLNTEEGRKAWVDRQASIIQKLKLPYLSEGITQTIVNEYFPKEWQDARSKQIKQLADQIGGRRIAKIGDRSIWETKWAEKSINN
jgi:hypothetical protein